MSVGQGWRTYGTRHSLLSHFFSKKFLLPNQRLCSVKNVCVCVCIYIYTSDCIWITFGAKRNCEWHIVAQIVRGAKCLLDIHHWGAGLAVTGRLRDIGQSVLQPFQTGSSSSPNYCHIFFIIIMLDGAFNRKVIRCINYNNAVINNNYGRLKDYFGLQNSDVHFKRISSKFIDSFGPRPQNGSPALPWFLHRDFITVAPWGIYCKVWR